MTNRKKEDLTIFEIYKNYLEEYSQKYGPKTIVLMQVGAFHELYGVDNQIEKIGQVKEIAEILNILVTRKDKSKLENNRKNHLMAGFPSASLDRNINILLDYGYTVVIVDQVTEPPNPERAVTNIYSPGTIIDGNQLHGENNFLMSIYFEIESLNERRNGLLSVGLSAIDLSTGESVVYETYSSKEDINLAMDESYRFIQSYNPREIIIYSKTYGGENKSSSSSTNQQLSKYNIHFNEDELKEQLDLHNYTCHFHLEEIPKEYYKISYQNEFLRKIFPNSGILNPIEYLDLEKNQLSTFSYLLLLQFAYEHNEKIVENLAKPTIWSGEQHLTLANNTIQQLNLFSNGFLPNKYRSDSFKSVFDVIAQTSTTMGRRLLKKRLLNPILNPRMLNQRYQYIENLCQPIPPELFNIMESESNQFKPKYKWEIINKYLGSIVDIERYFRKIMLGTLHPMEFSVLDNSVRQVKKIIEIILQNKGDFEEINTMIQGFNGKKLSFLSQIQKLMEFYQEIVDLEDIGKYHLNDITDSFFKVGYHQELDQISYQIRHYKRYFELLAKQLSNLIIKESDCVTLKNNESSGYYFNLTQNRYKLLENAFKQPITIQVDEKSYTINFKDFTAEKVSSKSTSLNLFSTLNNQHSVNLITLQKEIKDKATKVYLDFLQKFNEKFGSTLSQIIDFVSELDVAKSGAKTAIKYNYCQPVIYNLKDINETKSFIQCQDLRHPIIERINSKIKYVPHSLNLGQVPEELLCENENENKNENHQSPYDGMLVYGVNSCGKSSLMKSVGVNLVLAQAGMYVAAKSFIYNPYQYILTRILGNDNLFKGLSSFAVEMSELRGILKRANQRSLVLGDEICHGTETVSAVAIVASAILHLAQRKSSFIFATHLHQLNDIEEIQDLPNVKSYHLKIHYDRENDELVYDRNLVPGSGNPIYGLEVAKAMQLDIAFIDKANEIRKKLMDVDPKLLKVKPSRYNANLYLDKCLICMAEAEHTHHIGFQCNADENNFIGHYHKNIMANLVPLCQACHQKVHNPILGKQFQIYGYKETSKGIKLDYQEINVPLVKKITNIIKKKIK